MKTIHSLFVAAALLTGTGMAQALPITDTYTPAGSPITLTTGTPYDYQHSLITHGFDPLLDVLTSVTLELVISGAGGQPLTITFDSITEFSDTLNTLIADQPLTVALAYLQADGLLDVSLTKGGGAGSTFTFTSSTLYAVGTNGGDPGQIPEPGTLLLLGAGLIGAVAARRRRAV